MTVDLKVYKKNGKYFSKTKNKDVYFTDFYLSLNGNLIPIEVKYFPNEKLDGRDPGYAARVAQLELIAELLPEKPPKEDDGAAATNTSNVAPELPPHSDADAPPETKK